MKIAMEIPWLTHMLTVRNFLLDGFEWEARKLGQTIVMARLYISLSQKVC